MTVRPVVVAKLVILGILFLTSSILTLREAVVAKLVILGILFLTSFISALRVLLVTELVILGIWSSTSDFEVANSVFLPKSNVSTPVAFLNLLLLHH